MHGICNGLGPGCGVDGEMEHYTQAYSIEVILHLIEDLKEDTCSPVVLKVKNASRVDGGLPGLPEFEPQPLKLSRFALPNSSHKHHGYRKENSQVCASQAHNLFPGFPPEEEPAQATNRDHQERQVCRSRSRNVLLMLPFSTQLLTPP